MCKSSVLSVTDKEELVGRMSLVSRFPLYLITAMLTGEMQVISLTGEQMVIFIDGLSSIRFLTLLDGWGNSIDGFHE